MFDLFQILAFFADYFGDADFLVCESDFRRGILLNSEKLSEQVLEIIQQLYVWMYLILVVRLLENKSDFVICWNHTLFSFYKNNFIRTSRLKFGLNFFFKNYEELKI